VFDGFAGVAQQALAELFELSGLWRSLKKGVNFCVIVEHALLMPKPLLGCNCWWACRAIKEF
jgi:hypothetical protein